MLKRTDIKGKVEKWFGISHTSNQVTDIEISNFVDKYYTKIFN